MKHKTSKLLSILLALALVMGIAPAVSQTAQAAGTNKTIQLVDHSGTTSVAANIDGGKGGTAEGGVYFGKYKQSPDGSGDFNEDPIKWRVLENAEGKLFLLSDQNLDVMRYHNDNESVTWEKSTMRSWLNGYAASENTGGASGTDYSQKSDDSFIGDAFDEKEQAAIAETYVQNNKTDTYTPNPDYPNVPGGNDTTDKVFLLSIAEASNSGYGFTDDNSRKSTNTGYVQVGGKIHFDEGINITMSGVGEADYWWLRSPGNYDNSAATVPHYGFVFTDGFIVDNYDLAVRPALNLNLSSVLFTSAAADGKAGTTGELSEIGEYTGNEWKLTLKDESRKFAVTETAATGAPGETVTLNYTSATVYNTTTARNEYISAILTDKDGNLLRYGRLTQPTSANGKVDVKIPADLTDGEYTLKVFSEQYNGALFTDYASAFDDVTLTVGKAEKNKLTVTVRDQTYTYNGWIQGEGDTIYAVPAQIAQKVQVDGLKDGDYIYLVELFGQGTDAGEHEVTVNRCVVKNRATNDNVAENYDIKLVNGKLTINPATLTVTTSSASKVYDGKPLEEETATIEGFIRNDTATVKATGSRTDAGTSDNTYEIEWGATKASNYTIVEKLGTLTVTPKEASITVDSASKMQGANDPDFTGSVEGLVAEGDLGEVEYVRIGTDEAPGDYAGVLDAVYKANPNYNVTVTKGNFKIMPVTITGIKLNSDSAKKVYTEGDALDVSGLTLEVSKSDGSKETVNVTEAMVSGFDSSKTGKQILTVSYEGFTATYEVEVKAKTNPPTPTPTPVITYEAKDGVNSITWQKGSEKTIDLTINRSVDDALTYGLFENLTTDGEVVDDRYYDAASGSLKLTIKPEYLETLSVGDHTVKVNFQDGSATVKLTVKAAATQPTPKPSEKPDSPKTGDESNLALWSSLMLFSLVGLFAVGVVNAKRLRKIR